MASHDHPTEPWHLERNDLDGAVALYRYWLESDQLTPARGEMLLMLQDDPDLLIEKLLEVVRARPSADR